MDHIIKPVPEHIVQSKESLISFSLDPKIKKLKQREIASDINSIKMKQELKRKKKEKESKIAEIKFQGLGVSP